MENTTVDEKILERLKWDYQFGLTEQDKLNFNKCNENMEWQEKRKKDESEMKFGFFFYMK